MEKQTATAVAERSGQGLAAQALDDSDRWAGRGRVWREREPALPWPLDMLEDFSLRMAGHGLSISRPLMLSDRCYALQQLVSAQTLGDETLRTLSTQLFRHFEMRQSGIRPLH